MKLRLLLLFSLLSLACENNADNRNPFLQEVRFSFELNLNLPLYTNLNNIGNPIFVNNAGVGTRGAFVMKTGPDSFMAYEASCPNHAPNDCSTMTIDGQNVVCSCEEYTYNLFFGQQLDPPEDGTRFFNLLAYRATQSGNSVLISN